MGRRVAYGAVVAVCAVLTLTAVAGCGGSSPGAASLPAIGSTAGTGASTGAATSDGSCSSVTVADVAGFFTGPVAAGVAGTDGSGPGSKDCFYSLQGSSSDGFHLSTNVDLDF